MLTPILYLFKLKNFLITLFINAVCRIILRNGLWKDRQKVIQKIYKFSFYVIRPKQYYLSWVNIWMILTCV